METLEEAMKKLQDMFLCKKSTHIPAVVIKREKMNEKKPLSWKKINMNSLLSVSDHTYSIHPTTAMENTFLKE